MFLAVVEEEKYVQASHLCFDSSLQTQTDEFPVPLVGINRANCFKLLYFFPANQKLTVLNEIEWRFPVLIFMN